MNERERLVAFAGLAFSHADRLPAVERVAGGAAPGEEEVTHTSELVVVRDGSGRADDAAHRARCGVDENRRTGAIDEIRPAAYPAAPPARIVHPLLLVLVEVSGPALRDLDHEVRRGGAGLPTP